MFVDRVTIFCQAGDGGKGCVSGDAQCDPGGVVCVAVERLASDHERRLVEAVRTGEPDVQERIGPRPGERCCRSRSRLHRADTADERLGTVGAVQLIEGRGDDEDHGAHRIPRRVPAVAPRYTIGP